MAQLSIYVPSRDRNLALHISAVASRVGAFIYGLPNANAALPLTDAGAILTAGHPRFMPKESVDIVLNRERLSETGLPVLPTVVIDSPDQAPAGTLVKARNSAEGGFVYQPHLGFPQTDLDISFSVGPDGSLMPFACQRLVHGDTKKPLGNTDAEPADVQWAVDELTKACAKLFIKGGIHNVQFLKYENQWCVIDWNPRPAFVHTSGLASMHPYMDRPLAHMLGLPLPEETPASFVTKGYWDRPIPFEKENLIRELGLMPRRFGEVNGFPRVNGVGASRAEVEAKLTELEKHL